MCVSLHGLGPPLTHEAGLPQAGDGLSVVPAALGRGGARAGQAVRVRDGSALLQRVDQCRPDVVVGRGVDCVIPGVAWQSRFY